MAKRAIRAGIGMLAAGIPLLGMGLRAEGAQLIFRTGFEAGSTGVGGDAYSDITGADNSVPKPNDWVADLEGHPAIGTFGINYVGGAAADRYARMAPDPTQAMNPATGKINQALRFWLQKTSEGTYTSRVQSEVYGNTGLKEAYSKVRIYFHPDIRILEQSAEAVHWFIIQELWPRPNWVAGLDKPMRMSLSINKEAGTGKKFYWVINAEQCCSPTVGFWNVQNKTVEVPFGRWITAETYYKMGDKENGRFTYRITEAGQPAKQIFDVTNITYHPDAAPTPLDNWSPHKLYVAPAQVDFVAQHGGAIQIYWDDWELWDGNPGPASAIRPAGPEPEQGGPLLPVLGLPDGSLRIIDPAGRLHLAPRGAAAPAGVFFPAPQSGRR